MAKNKNVLVGMAVGLTVLVIAIGYVGMQFFVDYLTYDRYDRNDFIDSNTFQAVFLTNDQIYFGHLKNASSDYLILADVYYVKVNENGAGQLVKLGAIEPHKPKDKMTINQDQVLFWENLNDDSPVVNTIRSMQLQKK
ncbi:MAG: hypothetical protein A2915_03390 [Candidatus Yanofskybacteria bacterium RIFCSPLOWO2_01_FULL_41_34]|uniref:Uncharacterized protein n=1 Tax=Candidatus Yanofskybacteria bacterium RIFCSPHIGHO2_01_FULL_41_26 TaxID=1802661 RepID=A0A1F8EF57_9BACT|nr:MAG: hypothetical protein A2649_01285 [Candidatus Yanofskybacteria bacterium RIFCSPHIGHO2_01_FULL_41_26]OGN21074.1 MAG: hypothetical protein A2915_03390 [Candidatus Yanofskybacteria bacterium RIFCSPLOWO2_01_FULL_41_34]